MSFSYDLSLVTLKDRVRLWTQDTNADDPMMHDEEILFLLEENNQHVRRTALDVAKRILARFTSQIRSIATPDLKVEFGQRAQEYREIVAAMERDLARYTPMPYAGGISATDKANRQTDPDYIQPAFALGQHDTEGAR